MTTKNKSFKKYFKRSDSNSRGFSLIETLVAITILLVSVVGPISLISDSLHKIYYAKDKITAISLMQEGVEMVRQVRDTNMLTASPWLTNLSPGDYMVDVGSFVAGGTPSSFVIPCASCAGVLQPVYFDSMTGLYRQSITGAHTQFSRIISIDNTGLPAKESRVTVRVGWSTGGNTGSVLVKEYLFDWAS